MNDQERNRPRVRKITIKREFDEDPDTSHLGEYTDELAEWNIVCSERAYVRNLPEDFECPPKGREYRAFKPYAGGEKPGSKAYQKYGLQDFDRMQALVNGHWYYFGVYAVAEVRMPSGILQTIRSGGLWGIESDAGREVVDSTIKEELAVLYGELDAIGADYAGVEVKQEDE
jgi:hypothetical protein